MINKNSPVFKIMADYIAVPLLFLLIFIYCSLIFVSRSFLGSIPTAILIGLGIFAAILLIRGVAGKKPEVMGNEPVDT